jgi:hypothetical protein
VSRDYGDADALFNRERRLGQATALAKVAQIATAGAKTVDINPARRPSHAVTFGDKIAF